MLVLSRNVGQECFLQLKGRNVTIKILKIKGANTVSIGITAPPDVLISRREFEQSSSDVDCSNDESSSDE